MAKQQGIQLQTETEMLLFDLYEKEKEKRKQLEGLVNDLTSKLEQLQREQQEVRERSNAPSTSPRKVEVPPTMYETDEEELARETEWVRQKSRKKRKLNKSPSPQADTSRENTIQEKPKVRKIPLPPPIVVENVKNYQGFYDMLSAKVSKDAFLIKMLSGENVKINAKDEDSYRVISKLLTETNCLWHSYENKQDRPIRIMAKNLHYSCEPVRIVEDLALKGYKIVNAVNKLSWREKQPLNMFILSFDKDQDVKEIYELKSILGCKVDLQPLKSNKLIPQCKKCQAYGHTQRYCSKEPRCVKCTGKHLTKDCNKPPSSKPKCVHCGEAHPANYRGCIVAKELQQMRNKQTKKTHVSPPAKHTSNIKNKPVTSEVSFAHITKGAQPQEHQPEKSEVEIKLGQILMLMTSFDERLKKLETGTKKVPLRNNT